MSLEVPQRKEIEKKFKWDLSDIYSSKTEWEESLEKVEKKLQEIQKFKEKLIESPQNLYEGLSLLMEIKRIFSRLFNYAYLYQDQNTRNQKAQEFFQKAQNLNNKLNDKTSFVKSELINLSRDQLQEYLQSCSRLKKYKKYMDNILRRKKHFLSPEGEKVLGLSSGITSAPGDIFNKLNDADLTFPEIENEEGKKVKFNKARFMKYMHSNNRTVRKNVFKKYYSRYNEFKNTFASTLNSSLQADIFRSKARKYDSSLKAALD